MANSGSRSDDSIGRRRPRSELRELILQAGYEVLLAEGLGLGTEGLTYKRVFEHLDRTRGIRVTRGSVHERIWDSQREFQLDVLARAARWDSTFSMARTADAIADVLAGVDLATTDARFQALKEAVRIGARVNLEASESDNLWEIWEGVAAIISIQRELDYGVDRVRNEIAASYEETTEMLIAFFDTMIETLGLAVRPSLGLTHDDAVRKFAMISNALSQGSSLRRRHEAEYRGEFMLPTGPDREMEVWDLFSLGLWALSLFFFENGGSPINRADPDE